MNLLDHVFKDILEEGKIYGLTPELQGLYTYQYFKTYHKPILYVTSTLYEANRMYQILQNYTDQVYFFPMDDFLTSVAIAISPEFKLKRLEALNALIETPNVIVVTNLTGYLRFLPPIDVYKKSKIIVEENHQYNIEELVHQLYDLGYEKVSIVNKSGEMAIRGFVIDIFPVNSLKPVRLELWGDTIDKISTFDIDTQLTDSSVNLVEIDSNTEYIGENREGNDKYTDTNKVINFQNIGIVDYMEDSTIIYDDINGLKVNYQLIFDEMNEYRQENQISNDQKFMLDFFIPSNHLKLYYMNFDNDMELSSNQIHYDSCEVLAFTGSMANINKRLTDYIKQNKTVVIVLNNRYKVNRVMEDLENPYFVFTNLDDIKNNKINLVIGSLYSGYVIDDLVVITEKELYNKKENQMNYKSNFRMGSKIRDINKLSVGDFIVHFKHGIGKYCGIKTLEKSGLKKDYLMLEYAGGDKLYIPVEKIDVISKYSSNDGVVPHLNKLGGTEWEKTKLRIKKKIEDIAGELLKLYSKRETSIGFAFHRDSEEQAIFESEFPFSETPDQLRALDEIKRDMEKNIPMDRLLCGDVGYGKTEVAFRAMFKAMLSGKQVAMLCPTTILSNQHYQNALDRFKSFPVNIGLLNRFVSSKKKNQILNDLKEGKIDLLIGTHRILSDDVRFKDLGLLVIDEEQRFGVKHKEKIKQFKNSIDVLTLSATPIPRTLQMSMAGVRSLSLIETPPVNRYPIQTYVLESNQQIMKDAIYKELARDGQVFILYNRIEDMQSKLAEIHFLVPEARIISAHGRMDKQQLEDVMIQFINHEYDVLLCTTIIETGIDIPNVNTLIIVDADQFGLSQLYQIRGRVGRSNRIAYCYLMYHKGKILSDVAVKRLGAIKEFTELGSGFSIAMRDLAIRGAGDILGSEQAGFIDSVGVELFLSMLNEEVNKLKGVKVKEEEEISNLPLVDVSTSIADEYASEEELKIEIHKKINAITDIKQLEQVKLELEDRFGPMNEDMMIYMHEGLFESMAKKLDIKDVKQTKNFISVTLSKELSSKINGEKLFMQLISISRKFRFSMHMDKLTITLDTINLDRHFIYYLIDMLEALKQSFSN